MVFTLKPTTPGPRVPIATILVVDKVVASLRRRVQKPSARNAPWPQKLQVRFLQSDRG
jgi:hypothetical protein